MSAVTVTGVAMEGPLTCRACLRPCASLDVFSAQSSTEVSCHCMMTSLFSFSISPNDGLPSKICERCFLKLSSAYKFKILVEKSFNILSDYFFKNSNKNLIKSERKDSIEIKKEIMENIILAEGPSDIESEIIDIENNFLDSENKDDGIKLEFTCANVIADNLSLIFDKAAPNEIVIENNFVKDYEKCNRREPKTSSTICHLCGKQVSHIKEHSKLHDVNRKRIQCTDCPRTFTTFGARKKHKAVHHLGLLYYCEICKKHYKRGYEHKRLIHSNLPKPYECLLCSKKYHTKALLKFHMTGHTKEKPFPCSECGKAFRSRALCVYHRRRVHEGERKNICQYCSKGFFSINHLNIHLRSHTKEKNYKCKDCGKSFATSSAVRNHERRHSGVKEEQCEQCDMAFINKGALKTHMISHTKEKKHECKYCGMKFGRTDHRNRHQRTAHENKT